MLSCSSDDLAIPHDSNLSSDDVLTTVGGHLNVHSSPVVLEIRGHVNITSSVPKAADLDLTRVNQSGKLVNAAAGFGKSLV